MVLTVFQAEYTPLKVLEALDWLSDQFKRKKMISIENLKVETSIALVGVLLEYVTPYSTLSDGGNFKLYQYKLKSNHDGLVEDMISSFTCPMALFQVKDFDVKERVDQLLHRFRDRLISAQENKLCLKYTHVDLSVEDIYMNKLNL